MSDAKKIIPPPLKSLDALAEISVQSPEISKKDQETLRDEEQKEKAEKKKPSGIELVREGLRKKRKKTSFEYSKNIIDFDALDAVQQKVLRAVVDPKRIDAPLLQEETEAEVREFYHTHQESHLGRFMDALWLVTLGAVSATEKAIQKDLRRIRREHDISLAYYPGSGYDVVPRDALGRDRVIHLSREEHDSYYRMKHAQDNLRGYDKRDMELVGDFRSSPLKTASVDIVLVKGIPLHSALEALDDFERALKDDGLLLYVNDRSMVGMELLRQGIQKKFIKMGQRGCIEIYQKKSANAE